jgi:hypothetical protein
VAHHQGTVGAGRVLPTAKISLHLSLAVPKGLKIKHIALTDPRLGEHVVHQIDSPFNDVEDLAGAAIIALQERSGSLQVITRE